MTEAGFKQRIESSYSELMELIKSLGPEGLNITGPDGWAVKDHLIHLGAWELSLVGLLEGRDRATAMGVPGAENSQRFNAQQETEPINRALWALHRKKTPDEALAFFASTHAKLLSTVEKFSEADLQLPYSHYQPQSKGEDWTDRPVMGWVAGNTYEHYSEHIPWITSLVAQRS